MSEPTYNSKCADCGLDTFETGEWYMVRDEIWLQAWDHNERSKPGRQILCIGCLEKRIGRTLTGDDFTYAPINNPPGLLSDRMRDRLATPPNKRFFGGVVKDMERSREMSDRHPQKQ